MMDGVDLPNDSGNVGKWRIWMPDGSIRMVQGKKDSGQWITGVAHGKYMDMIPVGNLNGSSSTYYTDMYWISTATVRVVYRGYNNANANGGVSNANASYDASHTNAMSARVWPSAAKSSGRKAWQRTRRYARWRKRKAPKRGAKRLKRKNGIRMVFEFHLKGIQIPAKPVEKIEF